MFMVTAFGVAIAGTFCFAAIAVLRGKGRRKRPLLGAVCCFASAFVLYCANYAVTYWILYIRSEQHRQARADAVSFVHVGDPAPSLAVADTNGAGFVLDDLRGKVVLLNFFATWCGPCLLELPHIQRLWDDNRDNGDFVLLAIGREETSESVTAFQSKHGFTFPMAPDPECTSYSLFAKELIPRMYLISRDGRICFASTGFYERDMESLESELAKQLQ